MLTKNRRSFNWTQTPKCICDFLRVWFNVGYGGSAQQVAVYGIKTIFENLVSTTCVYLRLWREIEFKRCLVVRYTVTATVVMHADDTHIIASSPKIPRTLT